MNRFWRDNGVMALIIMILTLVASLGIDRVYETLGFWTTIGALLFVVMLMAAVAIAVSKFLYYMMDERLQALEHAVQSIKAAFGQEWLISREELLCIEEKTKATEIWILSRGLQEETNEETYLRVVRKNIKRGITYTYFVCDNEMTRVKAEQIKSVHGNTPSICFRFMTEEFFDLAASQDIAIFGPRGANASNMKAYMNLPCGNSGSEYFIVLNKDFSERLVGRLLKQASTTNEDKSATTKVSR